MTIIVDEFGTDNGIKPKFYAIEGGSLLLSPTPTARIELDIEYYGKVPALASSGSNWLMTKYPNIYLYKSLACACRFLMDDARAQYWDGLYRAAVDKATAADKAGLISGSPLRIRPR